MKCSPDPIVTIQKALPCDLEHILAIEQESFSLPWSRKSFEVELGNNEFSLVLTARMCQNVPMGVDSIRGYVCAWVVFDEVRFMTLAVAHPYRRQGIGMRLVVQALREGLARRATRALLEVRASNHAAQALYHQIGFHSYGTRTHYYTNPEEDAMLMTLDPLMLPASETQSKLRVRLSDVVPTCLSSDLSTQK